MGKLLTEDLNCLSATTECPPVLMEDDSNQGQGKEVKVDQGETDPDQSSDKPTLSSKNPVQNLNELQKGLVYEFERESVEGSNKSYTMSVEVSGEKFEGTGANKKLAKVEAAKYALLKMFNILHVPVVNETPVNKEGMPPGEGTGKKRRKRKSTTPLELLSSTDGSQESTGPVYSCKNPVMLLNECKKELKYDLVRESAEGVKEQDKTYTMSVEVNGETFEGTAKSKRLAKIEAAKEALDKIFNIKVVPESEMPADHVSDNGHSGVSSVCPTSVVKNGIRRPHEYGGNSVATVAEIHPQPASLESCAVRGANPLYLRSRESGGNVYDPEVKRLQIEALQAEKDKFVTEREVLLLEKDKISMEKTLLEMKIKKLKREILTLTLFLDHLEKFLMTIQCHQKFQGQFNDARIAKDNGMTLE
ncbi:Double-stranded RNA-specific editase 1 [Mizuhopecten yessoensis]|uniref:Double-stranded RNA-specific editase 1 n=1 Tax=Mizuhopecten yessoensis TaxID=6573 RepID=A0A210PVU4_MIZYE|nr:Double-stranded RNA-specific editase 1 [Mizuhopecten yessoensis]